MPRMTAAEIARQVEGELLGDPAVPITGVASLDEAGSESLSFLGNDKYASRVLPSAAGCVIVPLDFSQPPPAGRAWIKVEKPSAAFSALVETFIEAMPPPEPGVHPAAAVAPGVAIPGDAHVGACAVIEAGATIGAGSIIEAGCYVGRDARIGSHCRLWPNTTVREACVLGDRVIIHSGTVIGSDGFGYEPGATGHTKIPQLGIVQVDDDVEIGANCAIDRARFGRTWIKAGAKIDNLVQIAHNVVIGELCFVVAQVGIAGSCTIGRGVMIGGQAGLAGHLHVGDGAKILAKAGIMNDVEPGDALIGAPALPRREFFRQMMFASRMPDMYQDIKDLKAEVAALRQQLADAAAADQP